MALVRLDVMGAETIRKQLKRIDREAERVSARMVSDVCRGGVGWVARAVTSVYNVQKSDVMGSEAKGKRPLVSARIAGSRVTKMKLEFEGRRLTPVHFGMTPKRPPGGGYTLKMKVRRGGPKVTFGRYKKKRKAGGPFSKKSHNILMPTGAKDEEKTKTSHIPFQRIGSKKGQRKVVKFTALSVPQMIDNRDVRKQIYATIDDRVGRSFDNRMKTALKRL